MTTAREQAKKALHDRMREGRVGPSEAVDIVSDVWEPLVRDLLSVIRGDNAQVWDRAAIQRAQEALG